MSDTKTIRIGTRGSLLAIVQSRLVAAAIKSRNPELEVELVKLVTEGDRDQHTALRKVRDPGFFSTELDNALLSGAVDCCVHSMKDLPTAGRAGITRAAVPERADPRDVVLFHPRTRRRLARGLPIRIGSSSQRRKRNTGAFLSQALPRVSAEPRLEFNDLRGAVDERVARLHRRDAQQLDGVVLAMAGLSRLWSDPSGRGRLSGLLENVLWMILPLSVCPTAPAQGALAVECRTVDDKTRRVLASLHHAPTERLVSLELDTWRHSGYDAALGVTAISHPELGDLVWQSGGADSELAWQSPARPGCSRPFDGGQTQIRNPRRSAVDFGANTRAVFASHWRAVPRDQDLSAEIRVWVSGISSWFKLAKRGIWIEGCGDNLGFRHLAPTLNTPVLQLPPLRDWAVLTHRDARRSWDGSDMGRILETYQLASPEPLDDLRSAARSSSHFYWGSARQYLAMAPWLPATAHHACGPGKTAGFLRDQGIVNLSLFPSRREWRRWLA